jgi:hypothetical protein
MLSSFVHLGWIVLPSSAGEVWNMPASIPDNKATSCKMLKAGCDFLCLLVPVVLFRELKYVLCQKYGFSDRFGDK